MNKTTRKSKEDWLNTALKALENGGIEFVRIERLSKMLQISKSGFYYHFKDRQNLLQELLNYWLLKYTAIIAQDTSLLELDPVKRLHKISELIRKHNLTKYDLPISTWAQHDKTAKRTVNKVNKLRMDYIRSVFSELGFRGDDLETRAMLYVVYHSWERPMFGKYNQQKWEKLKKRRIKLLTDK